MARYFLRNQVFPQDRHRYWADPYSVTHRFTYPGPRRRSSCVFLKPLVSVRSVHAAPRTTGRWLHDDDVVDAGLAVSGPALTAQRLSYCGVSPQEDPLTLV